MDPHAARRQGRQEGELGLPCSGPGIQHLNATTDAADGELKLSVAVKVMSHAEATADLQDALDAEILISQESATGQLSRADLDPVIEVRSEEGEVSILSEHIDLTGGNGRQPADLDFVENADTPAGHADDLVRG